MAQFGYQKYLQAEVSNAPRKKHMRITTQPDTQPQTLEKSREVISIDVSPTLCDVSLNSEPTSPSKYEELKGELATYNHRSSFATIADDDEIYADCTEADARDLAQEHVSVKERLKNLELQQQIQVMTEAVANAKIESLEEELRVSQIRNEVLQIENVRLSNVILVLKEKLVNQVLKHGFYAKRKVVI